MKALANLFRAWADRIDPQEHIANGKRICGLCHKAILRSHRYHLVGGRVQHHDCIHPNVLPINPLPKSLAKLVGGDDAA